VVDSDFSVVEAALLLRGDVERVRVVLVVLLADFVAVPELLVVRAVLFDVFDTVSVAEFSTVGFS
jgi:hypothetical protein